MSINFEGKTAIISGAAGGIGFALAKQLGQKGMNVVMADIDSTTLETASQQLNALGISTLACQLDVTEFEQWQATVTQAQQTFGGVHMVINNAGVAGIPGSIEESNHQNWRWVIDVNLMGVLFGTQAAVPAIKQTGQGGWIINVASMAGMAGVPYSNAYGATKAAVVSMSEGWAVELKDHNIQVSVLCPAFVQTRIHESGRNMQDKYKSKQSTGDPSQLKATLNKVASMVNSGISPDLLAQRVIEALEHKQFYIFTHPNYRDSVAGRAKAIDAAFNDAQQSPLVKHLIDDDIVSL
jgi:NAD(P)-dependent dehydrogenase (short-subunit alcohol dehydrogenase family)